MEGGSLQRRSFPYLPEYRYRAVAHCPPADARNGLSLSGRRFTVMLLLQRTAQRTRPTDANYIDRFVAPSKQKLRLVGGVISERQLETTRGRLLNLGILRSPQTALPRSAAGALRSAYDRSSAYHVPSCIRSTAGLAGFLALLQSLHRPER